MVTRIDFDRLASLRDLDLGQSPACPIDANRAQHYSRATSVPQTESAPPVQSPPVVEQAADSFLLLALIPKLLSQTFAIAGAEAQEIVGIEKVRIVSEVEIGSTVHLKAVLVKARPVDNGLVLCRIGASIHADNAEMPAMVAELLMLTGNPSGTEEQPAGKKRTKR